MKKLYIILSGLFLVILTSCVINDVTDNKNMENAINSFIEQNSFVVNEKLVSVNNANTILFTKETEILNDEDFMAYATYDSLLQIPEITGEMFFKNTNFYYQKEAEITEHAMSKPSSIAEFLGINYILTTAKSETTKNLFYEGEIRDWDVLNLIQMVLYETESNVTVTTLLSEDMFGYTIFFDDYMQQINSIEIDLTNIFKQLGYSYDKVLKVMEFEYKELTEIAEYEPIKEDSKKDRIVELAKKSLDDKYKNIKTLKKDLAFDSYFSSYPSYITYRYESSHTSLLSLTGKVTLPATDTVVTLKINILYEKVIAATKEYTFEMEPKITRTGAITSQSNPLYQFANTDTNLELNYIDMVEQYGDSIYIKSGNFDMLIDAGNVNDGVNVANVLKTKITDQTLELLVITHAHSDHMGGLTTALAAVGQIDMILDYGYNRTDYNTAVSYQNNTRNKASKYCAAYDAVRGQNGCLKRTYLTDDIYIDILNTNQYLSSQTSISSSDGNNEASVTIILTYKNIKFYFSGDLDSKGESNLKSAGELTAVSVMKATHHGSNNGNTTNALNILKPKYVIVTVALTNNQIHPTKAALTNFKNAGAKVYCTFTNGTIKFVTNGTTIADPTGSPTIKGYYNGGIKVTGEENILFTDSIWYKNNR